MYTRPHYPLQPVVPMDRTTRVSRMTRQRGTEKPAVPKPAEDRDPGTPVVPFPRRVIAPDSRLLSDEILPSGVLLEFVPSDILNAFINYVDLRSVITERDPEEEDRYITTSNRFYTHFHEFGTVVHVIASSAEHFWYFCYDIDASDCAIGRVSREEASLERLVEWVEDRRLSGKYPKQEIDVGQLHGWRSFQ